MIVWVLILTINYGHQDVAAGAFASQELCEQTAKQIGYFGPYGLFEKYQCVERVN